MRELAPQSLYSPRRPDNHAIGRSPAVTVAMPIGAVP